MKKIFIALFGIALISCLFCNNVNSQSTVEGVVDKIIDATTEGGTTLHCRCKSNGCYGGNAFSFRASCFKITQPEQRCYNYDGHCVGHNEE